MVFLFRKLPIQVTIVEVACADSPRPASGGLGTLKRELQQRAAERRFENMMSVRFRQFELSFVGTLALIR